MKLSTVETILRALNDASVRYLLAGGLAVIAHGYMRTTADIDLILHMNEDNVRKALAAFSRLGYRPTVPVPIEQFADAQRRREWVLTKGLTVFSLYSPNYPDATVDLFVEPPLDFEVAYRSVVSIELNPGLQASVVSYRDLAKLKRRAGRPQDLADLHELRQIRGNPEE